MQGSLWQSLKPGFGMRRLIGTAGCLLVALAGITWGAGRAAAHGPGQPPSTTTQPVGTRALGSAPSPIPPAELYARRIRPLLAKNCYGCHGSAQTSGLDLRTRDGMLRGGSRGPALVPGNPEASRLYRYVARLEKPSMPPGDSLSGGEVAALKAWIAAGAPAGGGA
jgi:cytochrome c